WRAVPAPNAAGTSSAKAHQVAIGTTPRLHGFRMTIDRDHLAITPDDVAAAARRLSGVANRTPVFTSRELNKRVGAEVFLKAEQFQRGGAFKFRGAYNAL